MIAEADIIKLVSKYTLPSIIKGMGNPKKAKPKQTDKQRTKQRGTK